MRNNLKKLWTWFKSLKTWQKACLIAAFIILFPWKLITPEHESDKYVDCVFTHASNNLNATMDSIYKDCGELEKKAFDECMDNNKNIPNSGMLCLQRNADAVNSALKRNQIAP